MLPHALLDPVLIHMSLIEFAEFSPLGGERNQRAYAGFVDISQPVRVVR